MKTEFKHTIEPDQEELLKYKALMSLVYMMRSLVTFVSDYEAKQQANEEQGRYAVLVEQKKLQGDENDGKDKDWKIMNREYIESINDP